VQARSRVSAAYAASPLRLLTPANHGHAAWVYTSSYGGGLVDGDAIVLDVDVGAGASAFVSTQASTKVYKSPRGTSSELRARVGEDGLLVVAPDPVVCFAASRYRQVQRFDLAPGAALVAVDWMSSGRRASGERWVFDAYDARLSVRLDGQLLVHDRLRLTAEDGALAARMGRFEVLAILVIAGNAERAANTERAEGAEHAGSTGRADSKQCSDRTECAGRGESVGAVVQRAAAALVSRIGARPVDRRADLLLAATPLAAAATPPLATTSPAAPPRAATPLAETPPGVGSGCVVRIAGVSVEQVGRTLRDCLDFVPALLGDDPWTRKW
jgi:urease accessory protein